MKLPSATEDQIHASIISWFSLMREAVAIHIPNEGKRSKTEHARQKRLGLVPGAADIVVVWFDKDRLLPRCAFLEVKSATGRQRKEQVEFQTAIENIGHDYIVVRDLQEVVDWWRANA